MLLDGDVFPPVVAGFAQILPSVCDQLVEAVFDQTTKVAGGRQLRALGEVPSVHVVVASQV